MLQAFALKLSGQFLYLAIRGIAFDFKNCFKNIDGLRYEFLAHFFWRIFKSIHGFGKIITTMGEHNARLFEILDLYVLLHSHALNLSDPIFELRTLLIERPRCNLNFRCASMSPHARYPGPRPFPAASSPDRGCAASADGPRARGDRLPAPSCRRRCLA